VLRWAREDLAAKERVNCIYPVVEQAESHVDKSAMKQAMGLSAESIPVFIPTEGKLEDVFQGLLACGIVERIEHRLCVVMMGYDAERADRCRQFVKKTIVVPILHVVSEWDVRSAIEVCDVAMQLMSGYTETLLLVEAMGRGVPVVANAFAEPAELFKTGETFQDAEKTISRAFASGLYKLLSDSSLRQRLLENGQKAVERSCGKAVYQASLVKLYRQMLDGA
jgi:glycosyltransferase involved in cell wall biosynthesis